MRIHVPVKGFAHSSILPISVIGRCILRQTRDEGENVEEGGTREQKERTDTCAGVRLYVRVHKSEHGAKGSKKLRAFSSGRSNV